MKLTVRCHRLLAIQAKGMQGAGGGDMVQLVKQVPPEYKDSSLDPSIGVRARCCSTSLQAQHWGGLGKELQRQEDP